MVHARRAPPSSPSLPRVSRASSCILVNESTNFACIAWGATPCSSARVPRYPTTAAARTPEIEPGALIAVDCVQPSRIAGSRHGSAFSASPTPTVGSSSANTATSSPRMLEHGLWPYQVNNPLVGLALRSHPTTSNLEAWRYPGFPTVVSPHGHVVWADSRVHLADVTFVRVPSHHRMALHPTRGARRPPRTRPEGHVRRHGGERRILRRVRSVRRVRGGCRTRRPLTSVRSSSFPRRRPRFFPSSSRSGTFARAPRGTASRIPQRRSMVVSFVKDTGGGETARVDVYYARGTIATER